LLDEANAHAFMIPHGYGKECAHRWAHHSFAITPFNVS
jgi:hypothetical protein